ncbi:LPS-assembly protein LptD [Mucilaginibacter daejeonensis]|uniref:putative LPS assembly protein LptD n=1 Tax=Mucilaginibacter daejeonensis TaxID=398049 RepID=UPI001D1788BA|nr:putative LPS assembly protein LptD [Mucilaginibacter daejeonensis]UEG51991.1 LPS-assembly protein LptD [Mucilaginibacter daejeonensis]
MIVSAIAFAHKRSYTVRSSNLDTIIKLDPVKDKKLLRRKGNTDTTKKGRIDTTKRTASTDTTKKKQGGLESEIKAVSDDSSYYDARNKIKYYFGKARVTYEDFSLDAEYIRIDEKNKLIYARGHRDPRTGGYVNKPIAKNKDDNPITADSILYNYQTKKAFAYNTSTEQDGNFITGGETKKLNETEIAYHNILFSTCSLPYPHTHFGIVITKGIGEKNRIISGPAYLEIAGVPLPIAVPFGFFPKPNSRASGFILPSFGEDNRLGFFLRNFGYYKVISDYMDLTTMATLYSKGSFEIGTTARYLKRYNYQGSFAFNFGSHNYGVTGDPFVKDFNIQWTHSQDANASPGSTFSASVNAATRAYYANNPGLNNYNVQQLTQNNLRSSIAYGRVWAGTPFSLTTTISHSQDLSRGTVSLELPSFNFNMTTISPFDSKNRVGEQKWWQRITVGYSAQGTNKLNDIPESQFFKSETFKKRLQAGIQHQVPIGLNLNVFKYFQFNTSASYTERWYLQTIRKRYRRGAISATEAPIIDTVQGFSRAGEYTLNGGFSTKVYNTLQFRKGSLKAIRHVMTPNISFNYRPDFGDPTYGYYRRIVSNAVVPYPVASSLYSIYEGSVFGGPSAGKFAGISFSLDNTIEAKMKARSTDTSNADRKVSILQGLSLATSYNFVADSFKLSPISLNAHTAIFNQKVNISASGTLDPYVNQLRDSVSSGAVVRYNRRVDRYTFQDGRFPTLTNLSFSMSFSLNSTNANKRQPPSPNTLQNMTASQAQRLAALDSDPSRYVDFNVPYNVSVNYNFNYSNSYITKTTSSTVSLNGDVNVTPKWKVQYTTNYDFKAKQIGITQFSIYRDLHCWDLSARWTPFGLYRSFSIDLRVKASILQDLKLSKRRDYYNN